MNNISPTGQTTSTLSVLTSSTPGLAAKAKAVEQSGEVATEFESVFLSVLIKQLRDSVEGGLFGDEKSDTLGAMFDLYMGRHLADSQPLGIGKAVETYLQKERRPMINHSIADYERLGQQCIEHLEKESSMLRQFVDVSQEIRNVLGTNDAEAITSLKEEHQKIETIAESLNQEREVLRKAIAGFVDDQASPSIRDIEQHLSAEQVEKIARHREEISQVVEEIKAQTLSNTTLLQQSIDIYHRLIIAAMGQTGQSQTYLPSGLLNNNFNHLNPTRS